MVFVNPMFRLNQITQPIGIYCFLTSPLFQSHLRLRPLLSCTNITSFLLSLPLSPQLNQRNPPLLSTPIAPRRSLDHCTWVIYVSYFWGTVYLLTWPLCHSLSFPQSLSPVFATRVKWMTEASFGTSVEPIHGGPFFTSANEDKLSPSVWLSAPHGSVARLKVLLVRL